MSGVGITYLWTSKKFPQFVRLEGRRGDYKVYAPAEMSYEDALILLDELGVSERTCHEVMVDKFFRGCSECGYMWEYMYGIGKRERPNHCPNCGARVVE